MLKNRRIAQGRGRGGIDRLRCHIALKAPTRPAGPVDDVAALVELLLLPGVAPEVGTMG